MAVDADASKTYNYYSVSIFF